MPVVEVVLFTFNTVYVATRYLREGKIGLNI